MKCKKLFEWRAFGSKIGRRNDIVRLQKIFPGQFERFITNASKANEPAFCRKSTSQSGKCIGNFVVHYSSREYYTNDFWLWSIVIKMQISWCIVTSIRSGFAICMTHIPQISASLNMRRGVNSERRKYRPEYSAIGIITRLCVLQFLGTNLRVKLLRQKVFFRI